MYFYTCIKTQTGYGNLRTESWTTNIYSYVFVYTCVSICWHTPTVIHSFSHSVSQSLTHLSLRADYCFFAIFFINLFFILFCNGIQKSRHIYTRFILMTTNLNHLYFNGIEHVRNKFVCKWGCVFVCKIHLLICGL